MRRLYGNPNARLRTLNTARIASMGQLAGLTMASDLAADDVNRAHAELQESDKLRQNRKHMLEVATAAKAIVNSKDKRKRPKFVKKRAFRIARNMRLTRTKRTKVKRK